MKLILLSNPVNLDGEHNTLCSMFKAGLRCFHLRKPEFSFEELEQYIRLLPGEYYDRIVLHDHYELAEKYRMKGIHGPLPLNPYAPGTSVSSSFHSIKECRETEYPYEYAFLSPVFDSISKMNYRSDFDKDQLRDVLKEKKTNGKMIALGGISEENIFTALEYGFDGVALLGAVWMSPEPVKKFLELQRLSNSFKRIESDQHV